MSVNSIPISRRTMPHDSSVDANGSYTLPRYAFIPHPSLQQLAGPVVNEPTPGGLPSAAFAAPPGINARPYPQPMVSGVYGIRSLSMKISP